MDSGPIRRVNTIILFAKQVQTNTPTENTFGGHRFYCSESGRFVVVRGKRRAQ